MATVWKVAAPTTGQPKTKFSSPPRALVDNSRAATIITFPVSEPRYVDARAGRVLIRYTTDPRPAPTGTPGLWRTGGDGVREQVSPFALTRIEIGRGSNVEIAVIHPKTGSVWTFEGDPDTVATRLWRVGQQRGSRAERKSVYWAVYEFCSLARRQRGVAQ